MIAIRPARRDEAALLSAISQNNCADSWSESAFLPEFDRESVVLCAQKGDKTVGFAVVSISFDEGYLQLICVDSECRRQGVARRLLEEAESSAHEKGVLNIVLDVRVSNEAAIALYQKSGYNTLCTRRGFYSHPTEDAYTMVKELK